MSEVASPASSGQFPVIQAIAQHIERAAQASLSGSLNFDTVHLPRMRLFFVMGRLVWASGGQHRFRRWRRLLLQFCPGVIAHAEYFSAIPNGPCWEYQVLSRLIDDNYLSREQARMLICQNMTEILFDIVQASKLIERFSCTEDDTLLTPQATITLLPLGDLLRPLEQQWQAWCDARLGQYSPNLSPMLEQPELLKGRVTAENYQKLQQCLQGQYSLRELAVMMRQDLAALSRTLIGYEQQGWLKLVASADLAVSGSGSGGAGAGYDGKVQQQNKFGSSSSPKSQSLSRQRLENIDLEQGSSGQGRSSGSKGGSPQLPLVLCIDDDSLVGQQLGQVIKSAGYRYLAIQDSVKALHIAMEEKPDLIFVDLVMPVIGGNELCGQIRRVSRFKETPLIILTSSDRMLDRMRGKLSGASAYLTKPASPEQILATLEHWLPLPSGSQS